MPEPAKPLAKTEAELREAVLQAIQELRATGAERDRLMEIGHDVGATPDGTLAVQHAVRRHNNALAKLNAALRAFEWFLAARWGQGPGA